MVGPHQFWMHTLDSCTLIAICEIDSVSIGDTSLPWWWDEISTLESGCMLKFQGCKGYQLILRNKAFGIEILHNSVHTLSGKSKHVQYYKTIFLETAPSKSILWSCRCIKILLHEFKCFVEEYQNPSRSWYDTLYPMLHEIGSSKIMPWCVFLCRRWELQTSASWLQCHFLLACLLLDTSEERTQGSHKGGQTIDLTAKKGGWVESSQNGLRFGFWNLKLPKEGI